MSESIEEAYEQLLATAARIPLASPAEFSASARALALVVLNEAIGCPCDAHKRKFAKLRQRIEKGLGCHDTPSTM